MSSESPDKKSQLIAVLREGVSVIQMILFKETRAAIAGKYREMDTGFHSMMAGAITNELFGTPNMEERFVRFREENRGALEQELLAFASDLPKLLAPLTDALRVQTLCDSQEGNDNTDLLSRASELGILQGERDVPLPTTFMTMVRELGKRHSLIIPPVPINPEHDKIIH